MSSNLPKKWTKNFDFTTMVPRVELFFVRFLVKFKTPKRDFEINWPLVSALNFHPYPPSPFIFLLSILISLTNLFKFPTFSQIGKYGGTICWFNVKDVDHLQPSFHFFQICNALIPQWWCQIGIGVLYSQNQTCQKNFKVTKKCC